MKKLILITLLLFSCSREQQEIQKDIDRLETKERELSSRVHLLRNEMQQLIHGREILTREVAVLEQAKSGKRLVYVLSLKLRQERTGLDVFDIEGHIEYNGNFWHMNPIFYKATDKRSKRESICAQEIWDRDKTKKRLALENGYSFETIWESEHKRSLIALSRIVARIIKKYRRKHEKDFQSVP